MNEFPELSRLEDLAAKASGIARVRTLAKIPYEDREFPIISFEIGSEDKTAPTLGLFGGVHGLERVGTHLLLAFFESLFEQWRWDSDLAARFQDMRLVSIPLINPGGMFSGMRSNPNGIDLLRNAPVEAQVKPAFLIGGHRFSPRLPYYRGKEGGGLELEAKALVDFVREQMFDSRAALALDIHSGFGYQDQLWFPYAKTTADFPRLEEVKAFQSLLDRSYPNHIYKVEPQSLNYTTHGDLWDFLFDEHLARHGLGGPPFIPWTLEMGSWIWIRKNPAQLFSALGIFNPIKAHRYRRTMRRHLPLLDFLIRATKNYGVWKRK